MEYSKKQLLKLKEAFRRSKGIKRITKKYKEEFEAFLNQPITSIYEKNIGTFKILK